MRVLVSFALSFGVAIVLCCTVLPLSMAPLAGLLCVLAGLPCFLLRGQVQKRGFLLILGGAAGFLWFWCWNTSVLTRVEEMTAQEQWITAKVVSYPTATSNDRIAVELRLENGLKARFYAETMLDLQPGDGLTCLATIRAADQPQGIFDTSYWSTGIFLFVSAEADTLTVERSGKIPITLLPVVWSHGLVQELECIFSGETAALLKGILLGDKSNLPDSVISDFRRTGMSHLLVVSGLHISLLLWNIISFAKGRPVLMLCLSVPVLVLFVLMVGVTPSTLRATVMNFLFLISQVLERECDSPTVLCIALMVLLLQNPFSITSYSLQLSFGAVSGMMLMTDSLSWWWNDLHFYYVRWYYLRVVLNAIANQLSATLGAMLFTVPLLALYFNQLSLVALLVNLLCLWTGKYIFLGGALAGLLSLFAPALASHLVQPVELLCRYLLWMTRWWGALPYAAIPLTSLYHKLCLVGSYAALAVLPLTDPELEFNEMNDAAKAAAKKFWIPLCCPVVLVCAALYLYSQMHQSCLMVTTVLDVGQGACTALYSNGSTMLVDCGGEDAGNIAANHFAALGITELDVLILTHLHSDHFNGVEQLLNRMEVQYILAPDRETDSDEFQQLIQLAEQEEAQLILLDQETLELTVGNCTVTVWPPVDSGGTNGGGLWVGWNTANFQVLITGDADAAAEARALKQLILPEADLLLVGHHGSAGASSQAFLDKVRPDYAVISVGTNSYGHPADQTMLRLDAVGSAIYRTDLQGDISFFLRGEGSASDASYHSLS